MLSYLMSLIVNYLVSVLIHKPRKRTKADPNKKVWTGEASVDALSQSTAALLERRGLGALMLRDFSFQQRLRRCDINSQALEEKLRAMALEVTSHLSLPPLRQVNVVSDRLQQDHGQRVYDPDKVPLQGGDLDGGLQPGGLPGRRRL